MGNLISSSRLLSLTLLLLLPVLLSVFLLSTKFTETDRQTQIEEEEEETTPSPNMAAAITVPVTSPTSGAAAAFTGFPTGEILFGGVKIERNPSESKLTEIGVTSWPKWGCSPSKFPWTFTATETMYLLEGKVKVYCDGYDGFFEIGAGNLVEFPKGMKVTWDVTEAVNKHYSLEK